MQRRDFLILAAGLPLLAQSQKGPIAEIPADILEDKIRGGLLGQVIGDLNGLEHEMKYIAEPGNVQEYTPALPEGAWTDDDTDIEWPYLLEMQRTKTILLPYPQITEVWKKHINRGMWSSHLYLRQLMDLGIDPPLTGRIAINPWADFNLSGQFVSETWGLISPGMPRTAARIGIHYTHVSIDGEPVQSTQMMDAMIATAFFTSNMEEILDAGAAAVDSKSTMSRMIADVRLWARENPKDWRATRKLTKDKYCRYGGGEDWRDRNGVLLNGASTVSALIYGDGDFVQTVRHALNFGWDADNNAAASGAILGVIKGNKFLQSQRWNIKDQYRDSSRDDMPQDETITSYGDRLMAVAEMNIVRQGGSKANVRGKAVYRINVEQPGNVEPLVDPREQRAALRAECRGQIEKSVTSGANAQEKARAAYLAICLDFAPGMKERHPDAWARAIQALASYHRMMQVMFYEAPFPAGEAIRQKALAAGLETPAQIKWWV
ncbi:MAG TPA: ADP-ribosylglycohydrolase family protein [Candidatus Solibacter sp.]|nr:ADP-ribosylglycohydrolase family protein [Candidatus Solibacter sp.]